MSRLPVFAAESTYHVTRSMWSVRLLREVENARAGREVPGREVVMKTLRQRILDADRGVTVGDIVSQPTYDRLPAVLREGFAAMEIAWTANRNWGESFELGALEVRLGHRRGDHIAMRPHINGLSEGQAEEYLRASLEGTLLHELGHAVLDGYQRLYGVAEYRLFLGGFKEAVLQDGPPSTYFGTDPNASWEDALHEVYAEGFRYAIVDPSFGTEFPTLAHAVTIPLNAVVLRLEAD